MQVYLLKPGSRAQEHLDKLLDLLEQFVPKNKYTKCLAIFRSFIKICVYLFIIIDFTIHLMEGGGLIHWNVFYEI